MTTKPAPQPCAALLCEMFAPAGVKYCPQHAPLDLNSPDDLATWLECWVDDKIGDNDPAGVMARRLLTVALDALHAYFVAFRLNDLGPTIHATDRAALLFAHERCRQCGDFVATVDLTADALCGDCASQTDDEHRPAPTEPTACRACGEYTVIRDRQGITPEYCGDCGESRTA